MLFFYKVIITFATNQIHRYAKNNKEAVNPIHHWWWEGLCSSHNDRIASKWYVPLPYWLLRCDSRGCKNLSTRARSFGRTRIQTIHLRIAMADMTEGYPFIFTMNDKSTDGESLEYRMQYRFKSARSKHTYIVRVERTSIMHIVLNSSTNYTLTVWRSSACEQTPTKQGLSSIPYTTSY